MVLALIALWATARPARATGDGTASTDSQVDQVFACGATADPDDPDRAWLTWEDGTDDDLSPVLTIRTMAWEGMAYQVRGRVLFQGIEHTWTQDLGEQEPSTAVSVSLDATTLTPWSDAQADWTSDLLVQVIVTGPDGRTWPPVSAPPVRVVWVDGSRRLMTRAEATTLAPHGAWSSAAQAADPLADEDASTAWFDGQGMDLRTGGM